VKRVELIQKLTANGCVFIVTEGNTLVSEPAHANGQPVPRHREIKEFLARSIIKKLSDGP